MINGYFKMNKLNIVITSVLLVLFALLQLIHVTYGKLIIKEYFVIHPIRQRIFFQVNNILFVLMILITIVLACNIIFSASGNKRKLILFHYGKSYYMKYLLITTAVHSILLLIILLINDYINSYVVYAYNIQGFETQNIMGSAFQPVIHIVYDITLVSIFFTIVFTSFYLIDIFKNCNNRYKSMKSRNFDIIKFLIRYGIIWLCSFSLYLSLGLLHPNYDNRYNELIQFPSIYESNYLAVIIIIITIALVIDYYCFLKKKVLV